MKWILRMLRLASGSASRCWRWLVVRPVHATLESNRKWNEHWLALNYKWRPLHLDLYQHEVSAGGTRKIKLDIEECDPHFNMPFGFHVTDEHRVNDVSSFRNYSGLLSEEVCDGCGTHQLVKADETVYRCCQCSSFCSVVSSSQGEFLPTPSRGGLEQGGKTPPPENNRDHY